jgi:NYN domain
MVTRVFIDYRNMYHRAHDAFYANEASHYGNFKPLGLARLLTAERDRELAGVHVYCGIPAQRRDRKGYDIMQRRTAAWKNDDPDLVDLHLRTLRYPPPEGREKGVDVELATDLVAYALDNAYELAIICSVDSDLVPAIELVQRRLENVAIECVGWEAVAGYEAPEPLDIPGGGVMRRMIDLQSFEHIADRTNFVRGNDPAPGQSGRRLPPGRR